MNELELIGVEKMQELGYSEASMEDARAIYDAMVPADKARMPFLDNTISYAARDNEGKWWEFRSGKWERYVGPGRIANEQDAAK